MKKLYAVLPVVILLSNYCFSQSEKIKVVFENGDLVVSSTGRTSDGVLDRCREAYSDYIVGVFNEKTETRNIPSIIESGIAYIKFDSAGGPVAKGDFIASSSKPGSGMKAQQSGYVVGVALEDSNASTALLKVRVQVGWVNR